jgi:ribA/ribD-fused uncharacterized protein
MINEFQGPYRFLSNFWPVEIVYEGLVYPSVENAYQAAKSVDPVIRKKFTSVNSPVAKKLGQTIEIRPDWNDVKLGIMEELIRKKFENKELRQNLLDTKEKVLIEGNNWNDRFWGVCNGKGSNHLGKILMKIRAEIKISEVFGC